MPKCQVINPAFTWEYDRPPQIPWHDTVIYELHVKGFTQRHAEVTPALRGNYAGLATEPVIAHLSRLGVTSVELMPIHAFVDDRHLVDKGLRNYWGYNSIGFFAPVGRYGYGNPVSVHTIPFSSIGPITNKTRDFSYYVFDVGVSYREDIDSVMDELATIGK